VSEQADAVIAGRYVVTETLGEGGMGRVVRAHDPKLDREVAVKVLVAHAVGDAKARERMLREARAAAKLEHPGIVHVYDVGETEDGGAFLVMELVRGESLRDRLERRAVEPAEAVRVVVACARALAFAHRAGAVHRDVKPDNVMIREDGRVVLLDFGIAKSVTATAPTLTDAGAIVGTPAYLSPEQASGEAVDGRADQFALGVTLYEALVGRLPWKGSSAVAVIASMLRDEPEPASSLRPSIPGAIDDVLARSLAKSPGARYADLDAFADELEAIPIDAISIDASATARASAPNASVIATRDTSKSAALAATRLTPAHLAATELAPAVTASTGTRRTRVLPALVVAGLLLVGAATAYYTPWRQAGGSGAVAATSVAIDAGPKTVRMIDLPAPPTSVPEAAKAYAAGIHSLHDDNYLEAMELFQRAVDLDPRMAVAHFRLSMTAAGAGKPELKRAEYKRAAALRADLTPRDQALLDALEPYLGSAHPDPEDTVRRLEALSARNPEDAEVHGLIASQLYGSPASLPAAERAIALDPDDGQSWEVKGTALLVMGRFDDARVAYDRCGALSVHSADCLAWKGFADRMMGRCEDFERDLQHATDRSPGFEAFLVAAMASTGKPGPALRDVAARAAAGETPEDRPMSVAAFDTLFANFDGEFADARAFAQKERAVVAAHPRVSTEYYAHYAYTTRFVEAALEMGDLAGARAFASDFVARSDAWTREPAISRGLDLTLEIVRVALDGGDLEPKRRAWIEARRADGAYAGQLWSYAWAGPAHEPQAAVAALAALAEAGPPVSAPSVLPFVTLPDSGIPDGDIGRTYLLAGKVDDAIPYLQRAVANCGVFTSPFAHVHAARDLGSALEQKGDVQGACAAYAQVLARWGHAKPRSITADDARARRAALHCGGT
jgi:serine/threonine-protein kinase